MLLLFITLNAETNDWNVCDAEGVHMSAADAFFQEVIELRLTTWRHQQNGAPPVEFVEWFLEGNVRVKVKDMPDGDEVYSCGGLVSFSKMIMSFEPRPWKGHPAYEG